MSTALILGGAGSIATEIAHQLDQKGYAITLADIHKTNRVSSGHHFIQADVLAEGSLELLLVQTKPAIIVNAINIATLFSHRPEQDYSKLIAFYVALSRLLPRFGPVHYLHIGTTGTGGLGFAAPYTHGEKVEDLPLIHKSAFAGIGTAMLVLLSRSAPKSVTVSEVKPGLAVFGERITTAKEGKVTITLVDGGENGHYTYQELAILTAMMGFTTIERLAQKVMAVLEGKQSTLHQVPYDTVAALNHAIVGMEAEDKVARDQILKTMKPKKSVINLIATGDLGPPSLTRDLILGDLLLREGERDMHSFNQLFQTDLAVQATLAFIQEHNPKLVTYLASACDFTRYTRLYPYHDKAKEAWQIVQTSWQV